jgi:hypothetical protein
MYRSRGAGCQPRGWGGSAARDRLISLPATQRERIVFFEGALPMLPPEKFDLIISEDTLEHVHEPCFPGGGRSRLSPGGKFFLGFGP